MRTLSLPRVLDSVLPMTLLGLAAIAAAGSSVARAQSIRIHIEVYADEGAEGLEAAPPPAEVPVVVFVPEQAPLVVPPPPPAPVPLYAPYPQAPQLQIDPEFLLLQDLRRHSLTGPFSLLAAGVAAGTMASLTAADTYTGDGRRGLAVVAGLGFAAAIGGVIFLVKRLRARSRIRRQIRDLRESRAQLALSF